MEVPKFKQGNRVILIGPSGSGKSTLVSKILSDPTLLSFEPKHIFIIGAPTGPDQINRNDSSKLSQLKSPPAWNSVPENSIIVMEDVQLWPKSDLESLKHLFLAAANHRKLLVFCTFQSSMGSANQSFWRVIQDNATHVILFQSVSNIGHMRRLSKLLGHSTNYIQECMKHVESINRPYLLVDIENSPPFQIRTLKIDGCQFAFAPNNWLQ